MHGACKRNGVRYDSPMSGQLAFGYARGWFFFLFVVSLLFASWGYWLFFGRDVTFGAVVLGVAALSALVALRRVLDWRPRIVVRVDGIYLLSLGAAIPWDFVVEARLGTRRVVTRGGERETRFVLLEVRDPERLAASVGPLPLHRRVAGDGPIHLIAGPIALLAVKSELVTDVLELSTEDLDTDPQVIANVINAKRTRRTEAPKSSRPTPLAAPSAPARTSQPAGVGAYRSHEQRVETPYFPPPDRKGPA